MTYRQLNRLEPHLGSLLKSLVPEVIYYFNKHGYSPVYLVSFRNFLRLVSFFFLNIMSLPPLS